MAYTAGIPRIILEAVIDVLIRSMNPLPLEALAMEEFSVTRIDGLAVEKRTFWSMCLVHRSWTDFARLGLWYRVVLRPNNLSFLKISVDTPNRLLIRELALNATEISQSKLKEFAGILGLLPNLRKLYIDLEADGPTDAGVLELLQQLRMCSQLENLWLVGDMEGCYKEILLAVSCLSSLKSLVLDTMSCSYTDADALQQLEIPKSLESIAMIDALDWKCLSWLIRPREDCNILNLAICLESAEQLQEDPDFVVHFGSCSSFLQTLHVTTSFTDWESEHAIHNDCLGPLLSLTQNLHHFTLSASALQTPHLRLPETVIVFHLHHDYNLDSYLSKLSDSSRQENDRNIASVISESLPTCPQVTSSLRKMVLSFIRDENDIDNRVLSQLENAIFPETHMACLLSGVALIFETYASPYFGTLAESSHFT